MKTIPQAFGWLLAACALFCPLAQPAHGQDASPAAGRVINPADPTLLYVGRWDRSDPASYGGKWIAAYLRAEFTGNSVEVKIGEAKTLIYAIDDGPVQTAKGGPGAVPLSVPVSAAGSHRLLVGVSGGGGWNFQGLVLAADGTTHTPSPKPVIEFIGDSITCGSPQPIEAAGNYSWLTAEAMGCDHTQIAWPGRALTTDYGCQDDKAGLDVQYFQQNCFYDTPRMTWDFSTYTPKIVVINLGQNDQCGQEPAADFLASYLGFVVNIRAKFPLAQIVAMRPFSGSYAASIAKAVETLNARGDAAVRYVDTSGWLEPGDFSDGVHPNVAGNVKVADRLTRLLKTLPDAPASAAAPSSHAVVVGDPGDPASLASAVEAAYQGGAREIVVRPGVYNVPAGKEPVFHLRNWRYATVTLTGCTVCALGKNDIFNLSACRHVTLRGPVTLRHADPCGTQGRVIATGKDPDGHATCDWQVDQGYGTDTKGFDNFDVVQQKTRTLGRCDLRNFKIEPLGDSRFRIHWSSADLPMQVNDWLVHRYSAPGCAVRVSNSRDCAIDGVTSQSGGHATFFESDGSGGNHFLNCGIACGPRPPGATEEQLVANWADGLHSIGAFPGPDIENFTDSGIILDDCIAIRGGFSEVVGSDPVRKTLTLARAEPWLIKAGEPVRVVADGFYGQANVVSMQDRDGKKELTLDKALDAPAKADCVDPWRCGAYYQIINSHLGGTRSRGIIAKGDGGLIRGCTVTDCGTGILLGPGGGEAGYFQDATVVDNTVSNCREVGMTFESNGHLALRGVRLLRNRFEENPSWDGDLVLRFLDGAVVDGNTFTAPKHWQRQPRPPMTIEHCRKVRIADEEFRSGEDYAKPWLKVGNDVEQLTQDVDK